jgi:hypothetical protein
MILFVRPALSFSLRALLLAAGCGLAGAATAEPIRHPTAVFAGLDKTTGRIINFDVAIDETVQFGALQVTPRVCNTRPQTEAPQTTGFVEVDELVVKPEQQRRALRGETKIEKGEAKRIFSGWMFAASPGLHGVEHPVYDVWLVDCKGGKEVVQPAAVQPVAPAPDAGAPAEGGKKKRSRRVEPAAPAPVENAPIGPADATTPPPADGAVVGEPPPPKPKKKKKPKPPADAGAPAQGGGGLFPF